MCQSGKFISDQVHGGPGQFRIIFNIHPSYDKKIVTTLVVHVMDLICLSHRDFINNFSFILNANSEVCCINLHGY